MYSLELKNIELPSYCLGVPKINLHVERGDTLIIAGASGCGKSSLFDIIAGIVKPISGKVLWEDENIHKISQERLISKKFKTGILFQQSALISYLPIFENIALPLRHHDTSKQGKILRDYIYNILERVNLAAHANSLPENLSAGQQRMVGVARALATSPKFIFIDDPTTSLDPDQEYIVLELINSFYNDREITTVISTDQAGALKELNGDIFLLDGEESQMLL